MPNDEPSTLNLLAPNGVLRVTFTRSLNGDQCIALLKASQTAKTVEELEQMLIGLGVSWGIPTATEVTNRVSPHAV